MAALQALHPSAAGGHDQPRVNAKAIDLFAEYEARTVICTSEEARERIKQYRTRGISDLSRVRDGQYRERWDKIENALSPVAAPARKGKRTARWAR